MTHTVSIDVAAPVHLYDVFHAALVEHTGGRIDGLLAHVAWPTESGFRMIEVWTSKEARDRGLMATGNPTPLHPCVERVFQ